MKSYLSKLAFVSTFSSLLAFGSVYALNNHQEAHLRSALADGTANPHNAHHISTAQQLLEAGIPVTAANIQFSNWPLSQDPFFI